MKLTDRVRAALPWRRPKPIPQPGSPLGADQPPPDPTTYTVAAPLGTWTADNLLTATSGYESAVDDQAIPDADWDLTGWEPTSFKPSPLVEVLRRGDAPKNLRDLDAAWTRAQKAGQLRPEAGTQGEFAPPTPGMFASDNTDLAGLFDTDDLAGIFDASPSTWTPPKRQAAPVKTFAMQL